MDGKTPNHIRPYQTAPKPCREKKMRRNTIYKSFFALSFLLILSLAQSPSVRAQEEQVDFESGRWEILGGKIVEHLGRKSLVGTAFLKDVEFENGVIEVDVAVTGARSYPGVVFRVQSNENYERFYIRPHRAGLYADALQYTPAFNGIDGWQLYHGKGCTGFAVFPENQWFNMKIEVGGTQARVYLNNLEQPVLVIDELRHGLSKGSIGLMAPNDGTAFYSNFRYRIDAGLSFPEAEKKEAPKGVISEWEVSKAFDATSFDIADLDYPRFTSIFVGEWRSVKSEPSGLVDIARYVKPTEAASDLVMARTFVSSDGKQPIKLSFGYSDEITIFVNRKKLFYGNSSYRKRDSAFLGIVGPYDVVYPVLEKGRNEIYVLVKETFGGWGFMFQADRELQPPAKAEGRLVKAWETPADFKIPESVLYDPARKVLYVSSYNRALAANVNVGFLSKVKLNGEIEKLDWVTGLDGPCGMGMYGGKLYVVEFSGNLVEIDPDSGQVLNKYRAPDSKFLNDMVIDEQGNIYISDTSPPLGYTSLIYRFKDGGFEVWKEGEEIDRANGLFIHGGKLLVGNTGDGIFKAIDLQTKEVSPIACLGGGVIDGIRVDNAGNYLVSHWEGPVFLITPEGRVTQVLDLWPESLNVADFEFVKEQNLLVIPTFIGNKVVAYKLTD
jgi:sugar lactone lactonase YvrE